MDLLKECFGEMRVAGLVGEKNSGKTSNLIALIKNFRECNPYTSIYIFGFDKIAVEFLKKLENIFEVNSLEQLSNKKDCLIVIDEFQRLKLNDRRHREVLNSFVDFIYHRNNWVILCSPNVREFNSIIGGKIERWLLKTIHFNSIINGSQLKDIVRDYNGQYKSIKDLNVPLNTLLIINSDFEKEVVLEYLGDVDSKIKNGGIFK